METTVLKLSITLPNMDTESN